MRTWPDLDHIESGAGLAFTENDFDPPCSGAEPHVVLGRPVRLPLTLKRWQPSPRFDQLWMWPPARWLFYRSTSVQPATVNDKVGPRDPG